MAVIYEGTQRGGSPFQAQPSGGGGHPGRSPGDLQGLRHFSLVATCVTSRLTLVTHRPSEKMDAPRPDNTKDIKRGKQEIQLGGQRTTLGEEG